MNKKGLRAKADRLWHIACLKRWGNRCFFSDSKKKAYGHKEITDSCHHFRPKSMYGSLRYDLNNGVPVCWACHNKLEQIDSSMQQDIIDKRGLSWLDSLVNKKGIGSFQTEEYYKNIIEVLNNYIVEN